jgi:glycosyltransferase involved in cell wall biosynthesis
LEAVALLKATHQLAGFRCVILGTGSEQAALEAFAESQNLTTVVEFVGFVSDAERDRYYRRCAFIVYPSLVEPLGMPPIEGGLHGKAVIASTIGGPGTIVQHQKTGLLVTVNDPAAIAGAIQTLIQNPDRAIQMGQAAREHLIPIYGEDAFAERLENVISRWINA